MKKIIYTISVIVLIAVAVLILILNKKENQKKEDLASEVSTAIFVQTQVVKITSIDRNFLSNGVVEPIHELSFVSDVAGRVVKIFKEEGIFVKKGEILAAVDDEMFRADFKASKAAFLAIKTDVERFNNSYKGGGVTNQQLESMKTQLVAAESRYISSKRRLEDTKIKAPISGVINKKYIEIGTFLNPGARLFDIVDNSTLRVWFNVTEKQVLSLKKGGEIRITCDAFPNEQYIGKINYISVKGDRSFNYPVEVILDKNQVKELKPGMYVNARFDSQITEEGILVPRSAISGSIKSAKVFVVDNNVVHERDIIIGDLIGEEVEVLSGLKLGETIVTAGLINVSEGVQIKTK
ncbi:MAG: efflux RND transporter periplasmic adaptor subunit [Bacteroidales bacterium]|jgi:RND family efflux transporter MFP subunit